MKKKMGPLPVWAWGLILGVGVYFLYERYKTAATSSTAASAGGTLDPNAVDPNTGLTYGQEESAALNSNAAGAAGGSSSPSSGSLDTSGTTAADAFTSQLSNMESLLSFIQGIDPNFGTGASNTSAGSTAAASAATAAAASSPPVTPAGTPAAAPTVNQPTSTPAQPSNAAYNAAILKQMGLDLQTSGGLGPNTGAIPYINQLIGQGYKYGKGAASGTLTKVGSASKFFVFQLGGQTHVRQAQTPPNVLVAKNVGG
jgi:hypothetical protein